MNQNKVNYEVADYNDGSSVLPADAFRISPSSIDKFFSKKREWYGENLLGEAKKFTGSTSTVLGTCVHQVCEVVAECKINGEDYDSDKLHEAVETYIDSFNGKEDFDTNMINSLWKSMAEPLVKEFVLQHNTLTTEDFISHEIRPGIFAAGSMDAITSSAPTDTWEDAKAGTESGILCVRDWKTAGTKPSSFSWAYTLQAFTYAYILRKNGINIREVELCFAVRPTKTLPVRTFSFKKPFDDNSYEMIEGILNVIADSVQCFNDYGDLQYLLAGDFRLKKNDIPRAVS